MRHNFQFALLTNLDWAGVLKTWILCNGNSNWWKNTLSSFRVPPLNNKLRICALVGMQINNEILCNILSVQQCPNFKLWIRYLGKFAYPKKT